MQTESKIMNFNGENIYVGIDVHLKNWKVTIMIQDVVHKTYCQDPDAEMLSTYLRKNFPGGKYYSVYEAGFCGFSVHRELENHGIRNIVVNPADIPTKDKELKQKEDKRDSRKLARSLKNGELDGIYVLPKEVEELRGLVRYRKTLSREISRQKSRIKSFLYCNGVSIPSELSSASKYWSGRFTKWLNTIEMTTPFGSTVLKETLDTSEFLRLKLLKINRQLRAIRKDSQYSSKLKLLLSIPGIGLIAAVTLLSELWNISRFNSLDKLCSYVGLIPTTNSTGDKDRTGLITPRSNKQLRECIVEAAWTASRNDPALALSFVNLCKRMESNKAVIRIAKKLLNRIMYVLKNETEYVYSIV
jgi:transposase